MRRFALTTLRDFGMGKRMAEDKIVEECNYLIQMFEEHEGSQLISITGEIINHFLNYVNALIAQYCTFHVLLQSKCFFITFL